MDIKEELNPEELREFMEGKVGCSMMHLEFEDILEERFGDQSGKTEKADQ